MQNNPSQIQLQKEFRQIIQTKLLPWVQHDRHVRLVLTELPLQLPPEVKAKPWAIPPLRADGYKATYFAMNHWPEYELTSARFPNFGFVLNGEIDLRVGCLEESNRQISRHDVHPENPEERSGRVISVPENTGFIVPPGVPYDGACPHWFRPHPERAHGDIFWMMFLPEGIRCSTCSTRGTEHSQRGWLLAHDTHVLGLAELLIAELRARDQHSALLARNHLLSLCLHAHRALNTQAVSTPRQELQLHEKSKVEARVISPGPEAIYERASTYIQNNLRESLSLNSIAQHTYVSAVTLNRVFNAEAGLPVMRFVMQRRMESARFYLEHSALPIAEIGRLVGYQEPTLFSRAFARHSGQSPRTFRVKTKKLRLGNTKGKKRNKKAKS